MHVYVVGLTCTPYEFKMSMEEIFAIIKLAMNHY